jgi:hypothetical protein
MHTLIFKKGYFLKLGEKDYRTIGMEKCILHYVVGMNILAVSRMLLFTFGLGVANALYPPMIHVPLRRNNPPHTQFQGVFPLCLSFNSRISLFKSGLSMY